MSSDLIWYNGLVMQRAHARIGVEDRGFQFGDGVYEVIRIYGGRCFAIHEHLDRLDRSSQAIRISLPMATAQLAHAIEAFVTSTGVADGMVYIQLTRGEAPRAHPFPKDVKPTLLFYVRKLPPVGYPEDIPGVKIVTVEDDRWHKCWVKSLCLLPNVLAKQHAIEAGADEAVFNYNGVVTECCATNIFFVIGGKVYTHPVGEKVLPGITRMILRQVAEQIGVEIIEKGVELGEAKAADEIFLTSTTRELHWVSHWDGAPVKPGRAGEITYKLHEAFQQRVKESVGKD